jgi:hypothetical protein
MYQLNKNYTSIKLITEVKVKHKPLKKKSTAVAQLFPEKT